MERRVAITTGESVAFSYELAGLGSRFLAMAVDLTIQISIVVAIFFGLLWFSIDVVGKARRTDSLTTVEGAILEGIVTFGVFLIFFGYFIFFEAFWAGRTPGKALIGIRVVRDGGFPIDFTAALVRNIVRTIEFGLAFYGVSAIATLLSPMNRRFGDMAAGTIVIRDSRYERHQFAARAANDPLDDPAVAGLSDRERDLIREYAARRESFAVNIRVAIAKRIGTAIRPKLGAAFPHLDDDDLLLHLAETALRNG